MKKITLSLLLAGSLCFAGCYYDIEEELYPQQGTCDTTNVTYTNTIAPMLQQYGCTGCHGSSGPSGGVTLSTWAGVKSKVDDGRLIGAISHSTGFSPMPQGGPKMQFCDIEKIKAWAAAGATNN